MKFKKFNHEVYKDWIYLLPSIEVHINDPIYYYNNLAICIHFMIWHIRLFWLGEERG